MKKRVVVAMSGGVDSSVAAALLQKEGYEVIGITMCFSSYGENLMYSKRRRPACCGMEGIEDARRVCHKLRIRHYVLNMQKDLEQYVIKDFCEEYLKGRTPNPCVRCNEHLKFGTLLKKAISLDADYVATGHYARITKTPRHQDTKTPVYQLKKGKDKLKDQSYFLYRLSQSQLKHIIFPLGNYTKAQVRKLAREFNLPVADKLASQEICFLADADYRGFLKSRITTAINPGMVIDSHGNILGQHKGIAFYTVGQREGLGIALGYPAYVIKIDPQKNCIILGSKEDVYNNTCLVKDVRFIFPAPKKKIAVRVRIRYNHREARAEIGPCGNKIKVRFREPQFAITPGQSAVFYDKDIVLGGGIIDRIID